MATLKDITGQRFGRLIALKATDERSGKFIVWECLCDCGTTKLISSPSLRLGRTKSCGCLRKETTVRRFTTHGRAGTNLYTTWSKMIARCNDPEDRKWHRYGARGITVCERWLKFENFLADMGDKPPGTTLDRENNDGNYDPNNCRWATQKTQQNNRSTNRVFTAFGLTMNMMQWAEHFGIPYCTIQRRVARHWPIEKILSTTRFKRQSLKKQAACSGNS